MSIISILLEALSVKQKNKIQNSYGIKIIDIVSTERYDLVLLKSHFYPTEYGLGFQRIGSDFTDSEQQLEKKLPPDISWNETSKLIPKLKQWTKKYGEITVGSYDGRKNRIYRKLLSRYGLKTKELNDLRLPLDFFIVY